MPELTVITAASATYGRCVWQMLRSARRRRLQESHAFVVYDLGVQPADRARIQRDFPWCLWRNAPALPPHAAVAARTYAWKPIVVDAALQEFGGLLLWVDSATLFHAALAEPAAAIRRYGLYTLAGQSMLQQRCDATVWEEVGAAPEILHLPERATGMIGIDSQHRAARAVIDRWHALALNPRACRPLTARHRPEQALLSILIYQAVRAGELELNAGEIDISCPRPVTWMSSRNKVRLGWPTAADPLIRAYYRSCKTVDRALWRFRRWKQRRVDGWHRRLQEHYRVFVTAAPDGRRVEIQAPAASYFADPFVCLRGDAHWVFAEEFRYPENAGQLVAIPLDAAFRPGVPQPLDIVGRHLSFPFIFEHGGEWYLMPESHTQRTVDLYVCTAFPQRWQLLRRLLVDVDAVDSVLLLHANRWWLFTMERSATGEGNFALALYHTDDLFRGRWERHPVSAERRHGEHPHGFGRNAGPFVRTPGGRLLRPVHASRRYYGEAVHWRQVDVLTPDAYSESEYAEPSPTPAGVPVAQAHHVCVAGELTAWDYRDVTRWFRRARLR